MLLWCYYFGLRTWLSHCHQHYYNDNVAINWCTQGMAQTFTTKPLNNIFCHSGRLPPPSYPSNKNKQKEGLYFIFIPWKLIVKYMFLFNVTFKRICTRHTCIHRAGTNHDLNLKTIVINKTNKPIINGQQNILIKIMSLILNQFVFITKSYQSPR